MPLPLPLKKTKSKSSSAENIKSQVVQVEQVGEVEHTKHSVEASTHSPVEDLETLRVPDTRDADIDASVEDFSFLPDADIPQPAALPPCVPELFLVPVEQAEAGIDSHVEQFDAPRIVDASSPHPHHSIALPLSAAALDTVAAVPIPPCQLPVVTFTRRQLRILGDPKVTKKRASITRPARHHPYQRSASRRSALAVRERGKDVRRSKIDSLWVEAEAHAHAVSMAGNVPSAYTQQSQPEPAPPVLNAFTTQANMVSDVVMFEQVAHPASASQFQVPEPFVHNPASQPSPGLEMGMVAITPAPEPVQQTPTLPELPALSSQPALPPVGIVESTMDEDSQVQQQLQQEQLAQESSQLIIIEAQQPQQPPQTPQAQLALQASQPDAPRVQKFQEQPRLAPAPAPALGLSLNLAPQPSFATSRRREPKGGRRKPEPKSKSAPKPPPKANAAYCVLDENEEEMSEEEFLMNKEIEELRAEEARTAARAEFEAAKADVAEQEAAEVGYESEMSEEE